MTPNTTALRWSKIDIVDILDNITDLDVTKLNEVKKEYPGLLYHAIDRPRLHRDYHWTVFDNDEPLDLSDEQLEFLVGSDWQKVQEKYFDKTRGAGKVLDRNGFRLDLSDVPPQYSMSDFNLLSQGCGVKVVKPIDNSVEDLVPAINISIALSTEAASQGENGIVLWQQKEQVIQSIGAAAWDRVPDIMYHDYMWTQAERTKFVESTYGQKRDFLCARFRLQKQDVVLPFVLDFPGRTLTNSSDARVTAEIDGKTAPAAAISIPGSAFIGWFRDMIPNVHDQTAYWKAFRTESSSRRRREFILLARKEEMHVKTVREMLDRVKQMFKNPVKGSLCYYQHVRDLLQQARD